MSKSFLLQFSLGFFVLVMILVMFREEIFEPAYKEYLVRTLYVSAKERRKIGIKKSSRIQDRVKSAGLSMTPFQFQFRVYIYCFLFIVLIHLVFQNNVVNIILLLISVFFVPRFILEFLANKRMVQFRDKLPNAIDAIIRGAKAGLTISDCIQLVATDSTEPIKSEFRQVVQNQRVGMSLSDSFEAMADRLNTKETRLLSFVINIQQQTGGNISEVLGSLAHSIRADNTMRERAKTVTTEGKVTAVVVSMMPFGAFWMINSQYPEKMQLLFDTTFGNMILLFIIFWMSCGIAAIVYTIKIKI
jgi:tight adherence protein B